MVEVEPVVPQLVHRHPDGTEHGQGASELVAGHPGGLDRVAELDVDLGVGDARTLASATKMNKTEGSSFVRVPSPLVSNAAKSTVPASVSSASGIQG